MLGLHHAERHESLRRLHAIVNVLFPVWYLSKKMISMQRAFLNELLSIQQKNGCSLIWYIVLNSFAISAQMIFGIIGIILGSNSYSYVDDSGNFITIDSSSMNPRNLSYFMFPLVFISMVATVMIGQRRNQVIFN